MKQYWFTLLMTLAVHYGCVESSCTRNGSVRAARYDLQIDAFDERICGKSVMRDWQEQQSAFNCKRAGPDPSPLNADFAKPGEFPAAVILEIYSDVDRSRRWKTRGMIIHKNLLLVADLGNVYYIAQLGRPKLDIVTSSGYLPNVEYEMFCAKPFIGGYTALKLKTDIEYIPGKVGPACLKLDKSPDPNAICSINVENHKSKKLLFVTEAYKPIPCPRDAIQLPENICYQQRDKGDGFFDGILAYEEATLYCYDDCGGRGQRAYAVGGFTNFASRRDERGIIQMVFEFSYYSDEYRALIARAMGAKQDSSFHCTSFDDYAGRKSN